MKNTEAVQYVYGKSNRWRSKAMVIESHKMKYKHERVCEVWVMDMLSGVDNAVIL